MNPSPLRRETIALLSHVRVQDPYFFDAMCGPLRRDVRLRVPRARAIAENPSSAVSLLTALTLRIIYPYAHQHTEQRQVAERQDASASPQAQFPHERAAGSRRRLLVSRMRSGRLRGDPFAEKHHSDELPSLHRARGARPFAPLLSPRGFA
jgi:hypothetical protein